MKWVLLCVWKSLRIRSFVGSVASLFVCVVTAVAQTSQPVDLDGDGTPEFLNVTTTSGTPVFPGIAAHVEVHPSPLGGSGITASALGMGVLVNAETTWATECWSVGYAGIRFNSSKGTHYGWMELANPSFMGRPSFQLGGWGVRYFFNPEPNQPMAVGDTSLQLRLSYDAVSKKLRLQWNTDAGQWGNGLRIQSRPLGSTGGWSVLKTVGAGTSTEIDPGPTPRMFRAVHDN